IARLLLESVFGRGGLGPRGYDCRHVLVSSLTFATGVNQRYWYLDALSPFVRLLAIAAGLVASIIC
ncbi:hypothetical protein, partial [Cupriavidus sp. 8B]